MTNLFKKAAVCTDLHVGLRSNSIEHNNDCLQFFDWFIKTAKKEGCETCLFLGDWHHHRASVNILSLSYSVRILEMLDAAFDHVYMIPGNHDLYYREKRDTHSIEWAKNFKNITIVNDWFNEGNVVIAPWLVGDDYKRLNTMGGQYLFGHLELPFFRMNAHVEMPDHGELSTSHVSGFNTVFSGHFHKRQNKGNVWYIGNCFPHNYSDVDDDDRGMMVLEWGKEPTFHAWPDAPLFRVLNLSEIVVDPVGLLKPKGNYRVNLDIEVTYEEANVIKETLIPEYDLRELTLIPLRDRELSTGGTNTTVKFESVDQLVLTELQAIESERFDPKLLLSIYRTL